MHIQESINKYKAIRNMVSKEEVEDVMKICKLLHLPQKTLSISLHNFFASKAEIHIEPDDIVLSSACISLACKMCETIRPIDKILQYAANHYNLEIEQEFKPLYIDCIHKTEMDICTILDFDIPDFYVKLEAICKEKNLESVESKRSWIILNDILATPLSIYFTVSEIVYSSILITHIARNSKHDKFEIPNDEIILNFISHFQLEESHSAALEFISLEILEIYENFLSATNQIK